MLIEGSWIDCLAGRGLNLIRIANVRLASRRGVAERCGRAGVRWFRGDRCQIAARCFRGCFRLFRGFRSYFRRSFWRWGIRRSRTTAGQRQHDHAYDRETTL